MTATAWSVSGRCITARPGVLAADLVLHSHDGDERTHTSTPGGTP